jgi:hypothetical protein
MARSSSAHYIKLQIQYGSDHHELYLANEDKQIRIEQVIEEIEKLTNVPKCHQTIIYKGQRLDHRPQAKLDDLHLFNNSKLILSGTQRQFHDKYCCPDHEHPCVPLLTEKPTGFTPEPNKTYE